jgi:hypothetical protein
LNSDNVIYNVWQTVELGTQTTSSSGADVPGNNVLSIASVPGISSWLAVFDQYKIAELEAWLTLSCSSGQGIVDNFRFYNVVDYDDGNNITAIQAQQYSNCVDAGRNEAVYRRWRPHCQAGILNNSSGIAGSMNIPSPFIDSARTDIPHFGLKWVLTATSTTVVMALRYRVHLQFRNNI